jgi:hypothetical protein
LEEPFRSTIEGAPPRRPGERRIDYLAYLLLLGKLESSSSILAQIKSMKRIKEAEIAKAPKVDSVQISIFAHLPALAA